jgi:hypothetical protein
MLPRSKSRRITIDSERFRFTVSESNTSDGDTIPVVITVQHDAANGAILRLTGLTVTRVPINESKYYDGRTVARPIRPRQIADLVLRAIKAGWVPQVSGPPFIQQVQNADVFPQDVPA